MDASETRHTGHDHTGDPVDRSSGSPRTPTAREQNEPVRTLRRMRALLAVFCVLTALATIALFVLSSATDRFFAWTIEPPLTAALMGAGYAAGFLLVALSLRDPVWAHSRLPVLTILALHRHHADRDAAAPGPVPPPARVASLPLIARTAAWFWLTVYVLIPVAMLVSVVLQERAPGRDPLPGHPVPLVLRTALAVESAALLVTGVALATAPPPRRRCGGGLDPLTARVVAAWLIAFGVATALAAFAGDLARLRTLGDRLRVFGVLTLVAVVRYAGTPDWDEIPAWVFLAVTVAIVATGAAGWRLAPVPERAGRAH